MKAFLLLFAIPELVLAFRGPHAYGPPQVYARDLLDNRFESTFDLLAREAEAGGVNSPLPLARRDNVVDQQFHSSLYRRQVDRTKPPEQIALRPMRRPDEQHNITPASLSPHPADGSGLHSRHGSNAGSQSSHSGQGAPGSPAAVATGNDAWRPMSAGSASINQVGVASAGGETSARPGVSQDTGPRMDYLPGRTPVEMEEARTGRARQTICGFWPAWSVDALNQFTEALKNNHNQFTQAFKDPETQGKAVDGTCQTLVGFFSLTAKQFGDKSFANTMCVDLSDASVICRGLNDLYQSIKKAWKNHLKATATNIQSNNPELPARPGTPQLATIDPPRSPRPATQGPPRSPRPVPQGPPRSPNTAERPTQAHRKRAYELAHTNLGLLLDDI